jgi:MinD-like ATPase involved in chromosome partitioning or flagellar assembly
MQNLEVINDQAQGLRLMARRKSARVLPVLSNAGDPEQAPILAHLAMALHRQGQRVLIVDAGRVLLGSWFEIQLKYGLNHWLNSECEFGQVLKVSREGVGVMSAATGLERFQDSPMLHRQFARALSQAPRFDLCIVIAPYESLQQMLGEVLAEIWMITGTQALALASTFTRIKGVKMHASNRKLHMIYGGFCDPEQCERSHLSLVRSAENSRAAKLVFAGAIAKDRLMRQSILERRTIFDHSPNSALALNIEQIASMISQHHLAPWPWPWLEVKTGSGLIRSRESDTDALLEER